jgi:hypothetical protein
MLSVEPVGMGEKCRIWTFSAAEPRSEKGTGTGLPAVVVGPVQTFDCGQQNDCSRGSAGRSQSPFRSNSATAARNPIWRLCSDLTVGDILRGRQELRIRSQCRRASGRVPPERRACVSDELVGGVSCLSGRARTAKPVFRFRKVFRNSVTDRPFSLARQSLAAIFSSLSRYVQPR